MCPYLEFFWSVFPHIWTEYGEIRSLSIYSVRMREDKDQKNSEYWCFSRSVHLINFIVALKNTFAHIWITILSLFSEARIKFLIFAIKVFNNAGYSLFLRKTQPWSVIELKGMFAFLCANNVNGYFSQFPSFKCWR